MTALKDKIIIRLQQMQIDIINGREKLPVETLDYHASLILDEITHKIPSILGGGSEWVEGYDKAILDVEAVIEEKGVVK